MQVLSAMRCKAILATTLLLLSALRLPAQSPTSAHPPIELDDRNTPKLLTPRVAIHAQDEPDPEGPALTPIQRAIRMRDRIYDNMVSVSVKVVINESGRVESAHPTDGPKRFFAQAEEIVMHRAYLPARVDGSVVRATFQDYVSVYPQERWAEHPVPFPANPDLTNLSLSLERTPCFGSCPGYTVTIAGTGEITFNSCDNCYVAVPGTHHSRIPQELVSDLLNRFRAAKFLSALDEYRCGWTDLPSQTLTLSVNGVQKQVVDYGGSVVGLPEAVEALEDAVDAAAGTARWTVGNAETLPSLRAEHWNFSSPSAQNLGLFNSAITHHNSELTAAFLSAKAPITTSDPKVLSPLCAASNIGDRDLLQQLFALHPTLNLPIAVTDECLSLGARSGSVPVVQWWISRGARTTFPPAKPTSEDEADDTTAPPRYLSPPLLSAIQSGNPQVVALLLHAHADVSPAANSDRALISFALANAREDNDQALAHMLSLLIEAGADVNAETENDRPAIFHISMNEKMLPLLVQAGANVNQKDSEGETPLIRNAYLADTVNALLKAGADPTPVAPDGTTALKAARQANCKSCVDLIETALKERLAAAPAPAQKP